MRDRRTLGALAGLSGLALWLRLRGLSTGGYWRDDAWVALTSRVRPGTALRMGATAPGFTLLERTWILLDPHSVRWAQLLPLVLGVAGVVAMYALARTMGLSRWWSVATGFVVAVSPVALEWSFHLKQYSVDFLSSCLLLGLGEWARRSPRSRPLVCLGVASFVTLVVSASVVPILVGVWGALLVVAVGDRRRRTPVLVTGAVTAAVCGGTALVLRAHLPTALHRYWADADRFISTTSPGTFARGIARAVGALAEGLVHWPHPVSAVGALVLAAAVIVGAATSRASLSSTIALAFAFVASIASAIPLGTGRTDEVLYPAIVLLAAFGIRWVVDRARTRTGHPRLLVRSALVVALALAVFAVVATVVTSTRYQGSDFTAVATEIAAHHQPGDLVYVDARSRYPWTLTADPRVRFAFGTGWGAGYTVRSADPGVVISPSQTWERPYDSAATAARVDAATRVWFVGTGELAADLAVNPDYQALVRRGWRAHSHIAANGAYTVLLTRPSPT